jgi:hypothetical protein
MTAETQTDNLVFIMDASVRNSKPEAFFDFSSMVCARLRHELQECSKRMASCTRILVNVPAIYC